MEKVNYVTIVIVLVSLLFSSYAIMKPVPEEKIETAVILISQDWGTEKNPEYLYAGFSSAHKSALRDLEVSMIFMSYGTGHARKGILQGMLVNSTANEPAGAINVSNLQELAEKLQQDYGVKYYVGRGGSYRLNHSSSLQDEDWVNPIFVLVRMIDIGDLIINADVIISR
ncbi:MAG: hypothetical protein HeimC3_17100 [Candidatus Heimdallarchaeota archaeon LC_3]|nr:MAG: hypothetical protein HeimC3_17100 [Candidatus Heimdallarchaeota archaeon LC_3]